MEKIVTISLGGSLICPNEVDTDYLTAFKDVIEPHASHTRFLIVAGGGRLARNYINVAKHFGEDRDEILDQVGIAATRLNALALRSALGPLARCGIIEDPTVRERPYTPVQVACGWKPGFSTDYVAARLADTHEATHVINLTTQDGVYTADPNTDAQAKHMPMLTWPEYLERFDTAWTPGYNSPWDPVAARFCARNDLDVTVADGRDLDNLEKILTDKPSERTFISTTTQ